MNHYAVKMIIPYLRSFSISKLITSLINNNLRVFPKMQMKFSSIFSTQFSTALKASIEDRKKQDKREKLFKIFYHLSLAIGNDATLVRTIHCAKIFFSVSFLSLFFFEPLYTCAVALGVVSSWQQQWFTRGTSRKSKGVTNREKNRQ